ncbi:MAG: CHAT domain-containing protein, partial [Gemmatimonadaceae bacterium]|nr:CHAT domain-containing protein [Gemmatimonadaceae bacterium]
PVVHAATHGWLNASSPLFSRLDFARRRGQAASPEDDGRLDVHEVLGLSSRAQLVFLSGCETGVGPAGSTWFDRGEDVATLSLAFLQAGASNVIATLWRVEDEAAAAFAARFYAALADGMRSRASYSLADAVAGAQRTLREDPRYRAPYFWAAYALNGSGVWHHGPGERARSGAGFPGSSVPK